MIVAHVSPTPLEGSAWAAAEAFREAGYDSFCIAPDRYDSGREMPTDYRYPPLGGAVARLHQADVVFCHDAAPFGRRWWPKGAAVVGWLHGAADGFDVIRLLERAGRPWGVIGTSPMQAQSCGPALPELVPLEHRFYRPADRPASRVRLACFSPRGRSDAAVEAVRAMAAEGAVEVDVIADLSLAERLRRMAAAHVVVDDCIGPWTPRSSLEALALGCVVVNRCGPACQWNLQRMAGGCGPPFEAADLPGLRRTLARLIALGPAALEHAGRRNRRWMEAAWRPAGLIERGLRPLMESAMTRCHSHDGQTAARRGRGERHYLEQ